MRKQTKYYLVFWLINLLIAASKIVFTLRPEINLFTEEAQYWLWSQNLSWHYYSKPPLIAVFNFISTSIFGNNEFGVRINAILLGMGTSWIVYRFAEYLYNSPKIALWSGILVMAMPFWILFSTFHVTDSELTFFWILSIFLVYKGIQENKQTWWAYAGISTALGLMAKTNMILIIPVILFYLIVTQQWKKFKTKFMVLIGVSSVGFLPGFIWNWQNGFDTYKHLAFLSGVAGESSGFDFGAWVWRFLEYTGGQLGMISLFLLPIFIYSIRSLKFGRDKISLYLVLPGLLSWIGFAMLTLFTEVEANWPVFAYVTLPIFFSHWLSRQSPKWETVRNWGVTFSLGLPLLLITPDFYPSISSSTIREIEKKSFRRIVGYRPLAQRIYFLQDSLQVNDAVVFSESYHMASELAFYLPENPKTYTVNLGARKSQFDLWEGLEKQIGIGKEGIFVSWNKESPGVAAKFERLIYEEKFPVAFKGDSLRCAKIQIWENLIDYKAGKPDSY
jgi:hypothetical protein